MGLEEALELFDVLDITSESEESLKKRYRKLMTKYHPDNQGGSTELAASVSSAYSILKETIKKVEVFSKMANLQEERYNIVIPLSQLIKLYGGSRITLGNKEDRKEFGIKDIQKHGALIILDSALVHNGISYNFSNIQRWDISDNYVINCGIYVDNLTDEEKVTIKLEDKVRDFSFSSQTVSIRLSLSHNINVNIIIDKKLRANDVVQEN